MIENEKAKAYDEAIERAKKLYGNGITEEIFPELKDSEDDKIRKEIISILYNAYCTSNKNRFNELVTWLEKQGEQASSQTNERAWLYLVSDVLTWKDGIGQYLDDTRVKELAKKLCSKYSQKLYNHSNTEKNEQLYIRFGEIPTDEKSKIYRGEIEVGIEDGVSVYPAFKTNEGNIVLGLNLPITKTTLHTQQHLIEYDNRPCYLVKGNYIGKDTDGQTLINNITIIEKIDNYKVKEKIGNINNQNYIKLTNRDMSKFREDDWLGKQGKKSDDKVEPRFNIGDWITFYGGGNPFKILKIEAEINGVLNYLLLSKNGYDYYFNKTYVDENARLWTIQDAKDGDVLCCKSGWTCIFKAVDNHTNTFSSYCFMDSDKCFFNSGCECHILDKNFIKAYNGEIHPATKEQCDTLMKAMNDDGYEWDAEKKELKKLVLKKLVKPKFDPKTLKPFDKVICKNGLDIWCCDFFSSYVESYVCKNVCISRAYLYCIPYNDETKHLIGTTDEAPEFYKYWEE